MLTPRTSLAALSLSLFAATGCWADVPYVPPTAPPAVTGQMPANTPPTPVVNPVAIHATHEPFENPGGMWMPEQMGSHAATLKKLGLEIDPAEFSDPKSDVLSSIVSLGGCSASFVSDEGLLITNHHCATAALQYNATPSENLLKDGYHAKARRDERWAGPTTRVFVTQSIRDVTKEMREGLDAIKDDVARFTKAEEREKALVATCEKAHVGVRCRVASYFGGAEYRLIEQLEIKDMRLVFAPHEGVGNYGGEIDNWRWPRHDGDFAIFRAYVGKDGNPADHSEDNVPYHPPHHLKLADKPLKADDLVLIAGYPGTTNRLRTANEVEEAMSWSYPRRIKMAEEYVALLEKVVKGNVELRIKATPTIRGLNNGLTKYRGIMDGLRGGGLASKKVELEHQLEAWVDNDAARKAAYGNVLPKLRELDAEHARTREDDASLGEVYRMARLLDAAGNIVRMAEERPKPDAEREPEFQERNWQRLEQGEATAQKRYDRRIDEPMTVLALERTARLAGKGHPVLLKEFLGNGAATDANIEAAVAKLYAGTTLENLETRLALLRSATLADLKKSKDSLIMLALKLRPLQKAMIERGKRYDGAMEAERPRYIEMLHKYLPGELAPDANGTLRITYGTVRGYRPDPTADLYKPFTLLSEVVKKHTGVEPFDAPPALLAAVKARKFGKYVDSDLGEVPVDFLSDLDITGGNSGSAVLNARGELVGLAFDGNYESMASDWLFLPSVTRTIQVDLRYILWLLDEVYGAQALIQEMGGTPSPN